MTSSIRSNRPATTCTIGLLNSGKKSHRTRRTIECPQWRQSPKTIWSLSTETTFERLGPSAVACLSWSKVANANTRLPKNRSAPSVHSIAIWQNIQEH